jgi:hypothetical protein
MPSYSATSSNSKRESAPRGLGARTVSLIGAGGLALAAFAGLSACGAGGDESHAAKSFDYKGKHLTIVNSDADVKLTPYDGDTIKVDRYLEENTSIGGGRKTVWKLSGDSLELSVSCRGINFGCGARYEVKVPDDIRLDIDAADGSVKAAGFRHDMKVTAGDGSVTVKDLKGSLNARTRDGSLTVTNATGRTHRLEAGDGSITADHLTGALSVRTTDGSISAEDLDTPKVTARSGDGSMNLAFAKPPTSVDAGTLDGSLAIEVPDDGAKYAVTGNSGDGSRNVDVPRNDKSNRTIHVTSGNGSAKVETA